MTYAKIMDPMNQPKMISVTTAIKHYNKAAEAVVFYTKQADLMRESGDPLDAFGPLQAMESEADRFRSIRESYRERLDAVISFI